MDAIIDTSPDASSIASAANSVASFFASRADATDAAPFPSTIETCSFIKSAKTASTCVSSSPAYGGRDATRSATSAREATRASSWYADELRRWPAPSSSQHRPSAVVSSFAIAKSCETLSLAMSSPRVRDMAGEPRDRGVRWRAWWFGGADDARF